jgi:hypothetical protein
MQYQISIAKNTQAATCCIIESYVVGLDRANRTFSVWPVCSVDMSSLLRCVNETVQVRFFVLASRRRFH